MKVLAVTILWARRLAVLLLLANAGCSINSEAVKLNTANAIENERLLAQAHKKALDELLHLQNAGQEISTDLMSAAIKLCKTHAAMTNRAIDSMRDAKAAELKLMFEEKAWHLLTVQFPKAWENSYLVAVKSMTDAARNDYSSARNAAQSSPDDLGLQNRMNASKAKVDQLALHQVIDETDLRETLQDNLEKARSHVYAEIENRLAGLRLGVSSSVCPEETNAASLPVESAQALAAHREQVANLHEQQLKSLEEIHNHVNRPSVASLVIAGATDAAKQTMAKPLTQAAAQATGLIQKLIGASNRLANAPAMANNQIDKIAGQLNGFVDNTLGGVMDKVMNGVQSATKKMTGLAVSK